MLSKFKRLFYFPLASYFRFFAHIRLKKWNPRIVVVTGSAGKTTLLHMLEAQIGNQAKYSHHANSSFGIPFDILGLKRQTLQKREWFGLFLHAPFKVFAPLPKEKIYVVEADCDRPEEGKFLAELVDPEVVLWVSTSKTHSMNFELLVREKKFETVEEAIAFEYGYFLEYCKKLVVIDGDSLLQTKQLARTHAEVNKIMSDKVLKDFSVEEKGTRFKLFTDKEYFFHGLMPKESFYELAMCIETVSYLGLQMDDSFKNFKMPPGRGSLFEGIKDIKIIDSSYNANLSAMSAMLAMFQKYPSDKKWAVIGDMLEQGVSEKEEHEKLADVIAKNHFDRIVLMGPRVSEHTYPRLASLRGGTTKQSPADTGNEEDRRAPDVARDDETVIEKFLGPKEVLEYLNQNLQGGEAVLFKGARFLEGVIEHLLKNKKDVVLLARREKVWEERRKKWGL